MADECLGDKCPAMYSGDCLIRHKADTACEWPELRKAVMAGDFYIFAGGFPENLWEGFKAKGWKVENQVLENQHGTVNNAIFDRVKGNKRKAAGRGVCFWVEPDVFGWRRTGPALVTSSFRAYG